jgi:hypothetical protein
MNKRTLIVLLSFLNTIAVLGGTVNFTVLDHTGSNGLAGVAIAYNDYGNNYVALGVTNSSGELLNVTVPDGNRRFRATRLYSFVTADVSVSGTVAVQFQTSEFVVHVKNTAGGNFPGILTQYNDYGNNWITVGTTDANGLASIELFPGTFNFRASKNYSVQSGALTVSTSGASGTVIFQTASFVTHVKNAAGGNFPGILTQYNDYGNNWITVGTTDANGLASIELFPGTFNFRASKNYSVQSGALTVSTSGISGTVVFQTATFLTHVKNAAGDDFPGILTQYNDYGNNWITVGTTDANGLASIELFPGTFNFRATKNYSVQTGSLGVLASGASGIVVFQTALATMLVKDCGTNTPIAGINTYYNDYGNNWLSIGPSDVNGLALFQLFPGTGYKFKARTIYTEEIEVSDLPPAGSTTEFNPTKVCFTYSGTVKYNDYGNNWINLPCGTYMFPGTYDFKFGTIVEELEISGCSYDRRGVTIKLLDHLGGGIAGGDADYYLSGWKDAGVTDAAGNVFVLLPGNVTNMTFRMGHAGASQSMSQNVGVNTTVQFQTALASMTLLNSSSSPLAATADYYASGWKTFGSGTTTATMELLPVAYTFRVGYGGASMTKSQNIGTDPNVVFSTVEATMKLLSSTNAELTADADYYASGWKTFGVGNTTTTMELLPVSYTFRVGYGGASMTKSQNIGTNPIVEFSTIEATMRLLSSTNAELTADADYYASGWKTFGGGSTTTTMELLPVSYTFRVGYGGASMTKSQNIGSDPLVVFSTIEATMKLLSSTNAELTADADYYASGWKTFGTGNTTCTMELLPVSYTFRVGYGGASMTKSQNIGTDPDVVFSTVLATMKLLSGATELDGDASYYASGWKTFGNGTTTATMELLPVSYTFKVGYGGASMTKSQNINSNPIVIFTGTSVTLNFTGTIEYYASGWKTFTKPTMSLLPGTYSFRYSGTGYPAIQQNLTVASAAMIRSIAYLRLVKSTGSGIAGGIAKYYLSGWQNAGTTNSNGAVLAFMNGTVSNTTFEMGYANATLQKGQNIATNSFVDFQTVLATMRLLASDGVTPRIGGATYYAGGWRDFGTGLTTTTMELLPLNYSFKVSFGGATQEKSQDVGTTPLVTFDLVNATMQLLASDNSTQVTTGTTEYYAGGWKTFGGGTSTATMDLLPLSYTFKIGYGGATKEMTQNIGTDPLVTFNLVNATMRLLASDNTTEVTTGTTEYYAGGWKTFGGGTSTATMDLLPLSYTFKIGYGGAAKQMDQDIGTNPQVTFNLVNVTMKLLDKAGTSELSGGTQYYANGWKAFGTGTSTTSMDLLPLSYSFGISYGGARNEKWQDVATTPTVVFQTGQATSVCVTQYYAGGWKTFTSPQELLPGSYPMRTASTQLPGSTTIVAGTTVDVTCSSSKLAGQAVAESESGFILHGNYPNPFNPSTTISYTSPAEAPVTIAVFNAVGEMVAVLHDGVVAAGAHEVVWNASDAPSGNYFVRLMSGTTTLQRSMQLVK